MRIKFPQIITYFFLIIFIIQIFSLFFFVIGVGYAQAIDSPIYTPQVKIADEPSGYITNEFIGQYIAAVYKYGVGIVGILAAIVMMFGGVLWLTASGSQEQVSSAKEWIKAALTGLILASLSYIILLTINPSLVNFQPLNVTPIENEKMINKITSACGDKLGPAWGYYTDERDCAVCGGVDACEIQESNGVQCYKCKFTFCPPGYKDVGANMTQEQADDLCEYSTSSGAGYASLYNIDDHGCIKCLCRGQVDPNLACGQTGTCQPTTGAGSRITTTGTFCHDPEYPLCDLNTHRCYTRTIDTWPPDPETRGIYTNKIENINSWEECNNKYSSIRSNLQNYIQVNPNANFDINISYDSNTNICQAQIVVK